MGHANIENLSTFFVRRLYAQGELSIADCAVACRAAGQYLHAGEGDYDELGMICMGLEEVVASLRKATYWPWPESGERSSPVKKEPIMLKPDLWPIIAPARLSAAQTRSLEHPHGDGDKEITVFDTIQWKFAPGWRKRYRHVPLVKYFEN